MSTNASTNKSCEMSTRTSVFVLWSAGTDSTYLMLRLLEQRPELDVHAGYCQIWSNQQKTLMEQRAIKRMLPLFKQNSRFHWHGTVFSGQRGNFKYRSVKYAQVPYFVNALLYAPRTDFRALGYVKGDSSIHNLDNIRAAYDGYNKIALGGKLPKLAFPLADVSKEDIIHDMRNRYPDMLDMVVWCAHPTGRSCKPCGTCKPCIRRQDTLNRMSEEDEEQS